MVEEVDMPIDWVNKYVEAVLRMVIIACVKSILITLDGINSEHLPEAPNFLCIWILSDADQVFVEGLYTF